MSEHIAGEYDQFSLMGSVDDIERNTKSITEPLCTSPTFRK
ncbi:hypothetical protein HNR29_001493 [Rhizobium leguminosarum]|nr:hypothetical protein [Rhizobium leguminosarum]